MFSAFNGFCWTRIRIIRYGSEVRPFLKYGSDSREIIRIRIRIQENGWVGGSATLQRYRYLVHALVLLLVVPGPRAHLLHHVPPPATLHQPLGREDKKQ